MHAHTSSHARVRTHARTSSHAHELASMKPPRRYLLVWGPPAVASRNQVTQGDNPMRVRPVLPEPNLHIIVVFTNMYVQPPSQENIFFSKCVTHRHALLYIVMRRLIIKALYSCFSLFCHESWNDLICVRSADMFTSLASSSAFPLWCAWLREKETVLTF